MLVLLLFLAELLVLVAVGRRESGISTLTRNIRATNKIIVKANGPYISSQSGRDTDGGVKSSYLAHG